MKRHPTPLKICLWLENKIKKVEKQNILFLSNFNHVKIVSDESYVATENSMIYVNTKTTDTLYGIISTKVNDFCVRVYQNPTAVEDMQDSFVIYVKKGEVVTVEGAKSYSFFIYKK